MATYCAERAGGLHGLWPKKGAIALGFDADLLVMERADYAFDQAIIVDQPGNPLVPLPRPPHARPRSRTHIHTAPSGTAKQVLAKPGDGQFVKRQSA